MDDHSEEEVTVPDQSGRWLVRPLCLLAAALQIGCAPMATSGEEPPVQCSPADPDACWSFLGLPGHQVTALASTPWGLYAGTHLDGVYRYDGARREWEPLGLEVGTVTSLVFLPGSTPRLLAGVETQPILTARARMTGGVFASADFGRTWSKSDAGLDLGSVHGLEPDPQTPQRLYMRSIRGLLRSDDAGANWQYLPTGRGRYFFSVLASPWEKDHVWYYASGSLEGHVVGRSTDAGATWQHFIPVPRFHVMIADPAEPGRLWGSAGGLARSDDAGANWLDVPWCAQRFGRIRQLRFIGASLVAATDAPSPNLGNTGTSGGAGGLYASTDFARSWLPIPLPKSVGSAAPVFITDSAGRLVIGTPGGVWLQGSWNIPAVLAPLRCGT